MKIDIFINRFLSCFTSHEVITYFEKLNKEDYMDLFGLLNSYNKTGIENDLSKNLKSETSNIILKLYKSTRFPNTIEKAEESFDELTEKLLAALKELNNAELMNKSEKFAIIFYIFGILYSKQYQIEFIIGLLSHPDAWEINGRNFTYEDGYILGQNFDVINIKSIENFIGELKEINQYKNYDQKLYFRGHSKINYFLQPSLMRTDSLMEKETVLYQELLTRCPDDFMECKSHFEHLVKMQHYGLTTRLLDITSNPLIALYFACSANPGFDGEVIVFSANSKEIKYTQSDTVCILSALCKLTYEEQNTILGLIENKKTLFNTESLIEQFNDNKTVQKLLHEVKTVKPAFRDIINPDDLLHSIFVNPIKSNARIIKQEGAFILCGLDINRLNDHRLKPINAKKKLLKIIASSKDSILNELDNYGINDASVFPEIDKVSQYLIKNISNL